MPEPRLRALPVLALATAAMALGAVASTAEGQRAPRPAPAPEPRCPALQPKPASPALTGAFGVLRRERTPADALPREALDALRLRGLTPTDPAAARRIRETAAGGRAWVVPVVDVVGCGPALAVPRPAPVPRRTRPRRGAPAPPRRGSTPAPPRRGTTPLPPGPARRPAPPHVPREGLVVVATGDAPSGAGGALRDLVRGLGSPAAEPCAGPRRDMTAVSGLVPDGVAAVHLTAPDGTAVRADVRDNAYAFVVRGDRRPAPRYVVWTGGDGTPHVQPVVVHRASGAACRRRAPGVPGVRIDAGGCGSLPLRVPGPVRTGRPPLPALLPAPPCAMVAFAAPPPRVAPPRRRGG